MWGPVFVLQGLQREVACAEIIVKQTHLHEVSYASPRITVQAVDSCRAI
jgi:hypothetical protein